MQERTDPFGILTVRTRFRCFSCRVYFQIAPRKVSTSTNRRSRRTPEALPYISIRCREGVVQLSLFFPITPPGERRLLRPTPYPVPQPIRAAQAQRQNQRNDGRRKAEGPMAASLARYPAIAGRGCALLVSLPPALLPLRAGCRAATHHVVNSPHAAEELECLKQSGSRG
jgi:hypothetical protein